ncbi:proline racemase family protein [Haloferula sp.]|uniref:proline racemase family protein n=1 Tax=Haloferula sp. TaxID=2497595 RepID=UPI00329F99E7
MEPAGLQKINFIDSHTAGEPTRVIVSGAAQPEGRTMAEKRESFRRDLDWLRSASVCEPRGHDAMVGVLLCEPAEEDCVTGLIFFNNVGVLNGCLHATMGAAITLMHLGKIDSGVHRFDTPTGVVTVEVGEAGEVTVENTRSFRHKTDVEVKLPGAGTVCGDVAWGGNWFYLAEAPEGMVVEAANIEELTAFAWAIRHQLSENGITGADGGEIDHIELFSRQVVAHADGKNFVLCPGKAYDRSPCGTGTSAKLACLHASGDLKEGELWRQAGILDTIFEGQVKEAPEGGVIPVVTGSAFITAEGNLLIDPSEPFAFGIPSFLS